MMVRALLILVLAMGSMGGAYAYGLRNGRAVEQAAQASANDAVQRKLKHVADQLSEAAGQIESYRSAQLILSREIENETRADPAAGSRVPSADSLRRLTARFGGARHAP